MERKQKQNELCKKYNLNNREANKFYEVASTILATNEKQTKVYFEVDFLKNPVQSKLLNVDSKGSYTLTNEGKIEAKEFFSIK